MKKFVENERTNSLRVRDGEFISSGGSRGGKLCCTKFSEDTELGWDILEAKCKDTGDGVWVLLHAGAHREYSVELLNLKNADNWIRVLSVGEGTIHV